MGLDMHAGCSSMIDSTPSQICNWPSLSLQSKSTAIESRSTDTKQLGVAFCAFPFLAILMLICFTDQTLQLALRMVLCSLPLYSF